MASVSVNIIFVIIFKINTDRFNILSQAIYISIELYKNVINIFRCDNLFLLPLYRTTTNFAIIRLSLYHDKNNKT